MGWAERIPSGKYRAVYRDAAGRKRSAGTFFRESDALREAGKAEVDERNMPTVAETKKMTWGNSKNSGTLDAWSSRGPERQMNRS